jgi:hypothetical protein
VRRSSQTLRCPYLTSLSCDQTLWADRLLSGGNSPDHSRSHCGPARSVAHQENARGEIDALRARYAGLRRYFPAFFALPVHSEPGSDAIATGLDLVRQLDTDVLHTLPAHTPTALIPGRFQAALHHADATLDRRTWELGLAVAVREAIYVLDGLLNNATVLRPQEHFVDQHGFTDQLFGLCHLLGFTFMPRLNVSKQTLYKLDRATSYGPRDDVITSTGDTALIREQWGQLVRVAASLRNRTAPAHVVLRRLASSAPSDRLAKALTALGRALRSLYLVRYIHEEDLRARMQLQVNRGEGRHQVARRLFFANQGAFQTGDYEEIMNKATCLSLLSNAALVWNTVQMSRIVDQLRASGETITEAELARISPLAFSHIIPNGTYFSQRTAGEQRRVSNGHRRPGGAEGGAAI